MYSVEELCRSICNKIFSSTREGYGIFYEDELLDILPEENRTRETLEAVLKQLVNDGYAEVKYAKGNAFCIMGLKQYEEPEPPPLPPAKPTKKRLSYTTLVAIQCAAAALGGALGSYICGMIFYAV